MVTFEVFQVVDIYIILDAFPYLSCGVGLGREAIDTKEDIGAVEKVFHEGKEDRTFTDSIDVTTFIEDCHLSEGGGVVGKVVGVIICSDGRHQTIGIAFVVPYMVLVFRCPEVNAWVLRMPGVVREVRIGFEAEEFEIFFITGEVGATIQNVGFWCPKASNSERKGDEE